MNPKKVLLWGLWVNPKAETPQLQTLSHGAQGPHPKDCAKCTASELRTSRKDSVGRGLIQNPKATSWAGRTAGIESRGKDQDLLLLSLVARFDSLAWFLNNIPGSCMYKHRHGALRVSTSGNLSRCSTAILVGILLSRAIVCANSSALPSPHLYTSAKKSP